MLFEEDIGDFSVGLWGGLLDFPPFWEKLDIDVDEEDFAAVPSPLVSWWSPAGFSSAKYKKYQFNIS